MAKKPQKRPVRNQATGRPSDKMDPGVFDRLAEAMKRRDTTHYSLATKAGCDPSYFSKLMSRRSGGRKYMQAFARALGVRWDWLMFGEGEMDAVPPVNQPAKPGTGPAAQVEVTVGDSVLVLPWNGGPLGLRVL